MSRALNVSEGVTPIVVKKLPRELNIILIERTWIPAPAFAGVTTLRRNDKVR